MMDATGGLSELASSALPSLNLRADVPTWNRSLRDLMGASETLLHHPSSGDVGSGRFVEPPPLMGGNALGPPPILTAASKPSKKAEPFLSITEILQKRQDEILNSIWRQEEEDTSRRLQEMVDKQLQEDWNREREKWLQDIAGTRTLGGLSLLAQNAMIPTQMAGQNAYTTSSRNHLQVTPAIIQAHLEVVRRIKDGIDTNEEFQKVAITLGNSRQASAYGTAWRLLSFITGRSVGDGFGLAAAFGALRHLAKLFETGITSRVQSAMLANQSLNNTAMYTNPMANKIAIYVQLQHGSNAGVWPVLFYALRCGNAIAASEILDKATELSNDGVIVPLRRALAPLSQRQVDSTLVWETTMIPNEDHKLLSDLYDVAVNQEPKNAYRMGVLALLSGKNPIQSSIESTVEDYLYKELWKVTQGSNPLDGIAELGESIKRYGAAYFEDEDPFGWPFALPLLLTQQYRTALSYLAEAGGPMGLLQATHLGIALHLAGNNLKDYGDSSTTTSENLLSTLLEQYATFIRSEQSLGNVPALEYLVRIPQRDRAMKEVATLIVKTRDIPTIAGTLGPQGERVPGALDQHLNPATVSAILADAGKALLNDGYDKGKANDAGNLFMLAGQYSSILDMLNQMLFPPEDMPEDRPYWFEQTQIFHTAYLSKRSRVLEVLEEQNKLPLISVSSILMDLCRFFDRLRNNQFAEALVIMDLLQMLPNSRDELQARGTSYGSLDPLLQQSFPSVLKGTLKALYEQHALLKRESQGRITDTVQQALKDLRARAGLLVAFAGLLPGITSDVRNVMSQMEARML